MAGAVEQARPVRTFDMSVWLVEGPTHQKSPKLKRHHVTLHVFDIAWPPPLTIVQVSSYIVHTSPIWVGSQHGREPQTANGPTSEPWRGHPWHLVRDAFMHELMAGTGGAYTY